MVVVIAVLVLILATAFWYGLVPYLLMLLANSLFNEDFAFWQILLIWFLIVFISGRIGGNKNNSK